jgi:putative ABC transport system permease protein
MIISESMAELFFPNQDPLGQTLIVDMMGEMVVHEVVGLVSNARLSRITSQPFHAMYMSYLQVPSPSMWMVVRTAGNPTGLTQPIREILRAKDRNIPLAEPATMTSILDGALADFRIITSTLGLFSFIALLMALVGLYSVLAYYVSQRYHEIGVRMALGASRRKVANIILFRGMGMVVAGLAVGMVGSYWGTRLLQQLLYSVEPFDPATFIVAAVSFGAIALMACLLPAWRATRVDPVNIMQAE